MICPLSAISNSAQAILYNEANVEYIKTLEEKLSDCHKIDSASAEQNRQYKQIVILKTSQLDLCMEAATTCEDKYVKVKSQNKRLKTIAIQSIALNIILVLLVL